jgi:BASS family bile acid:Na+ symporter
MPIAGSSTAWSQNVGGNMAVSVGLVVLSTVLSPLTTPVAIFLLTFQATGDNAAHLHQLAAHGTQVFLMICVVVPAVLGGIIGWRVGEEGLASAKPHLKLLNQLLLLTLIYSNAATSLPAAIAYPDPDFLITSLAISIALCALAFGSGWALAALFRVDARQRSSLMFGLGMNNNGTGLVLASVAMANHPRVMLPIITYNLVQHLVAGTVAFILGRSATAAEPRPAAK